MATEHVSITDPDIHEPKGVASAVAGQVYVADGAGSGAWANQAGLPSTEVHVESASDFPAAVAGVRTLADNTLYKIYGDIDLGSDRLVLGINSILSGNHRQIGSLTSTTTGNFISATGVSIRIEALRITATSSTNVINFAGTGSEICSIRDITSLGAGAKFASISNCIATIFDYSVITATTDVITFTGTNGSITMDVVNLGGQTGSAIDLDAATFTSISMMSVTFGGTGGADIGLKGAANNANLATSTSLARVESCSFSATTPLSGIDQADKQFIFEKCSNVADSARQAMGYVNGNATTTTIASSVTPVKVNVGTGFVADVEKQFTVANDGRITYGGIQDDDFQVTYAVQFTGASGTNTFNFYIAKNGTVINSSQLGREVASTGTAAVSCFAIVEMAQNDYLEVWVENDGSTTDCNVLDMKLAVR